MPIRTLGDGAPWHDDGFIPRKKIMDPEGQAGSCGPSAPSAVIRESVAEEVGMRIHFPEWTVDDPEVKRLVVDPFDALEERLRRVGDKVLSGRDIVHAIPHIPTLLYEIDLMGGGRLFDFHAKTGQLKFKDLRQNARNYDTYLEANRKARRVIYRNAEGTTSSIEGDDFNVDENGNIILNGGRIVEASSIIMVRGFPSLRRVPSRITHDAYDGEYASISHYSDEGCVWTHDPSLPPGSVRFAWRSHVFPFVFSQVEQADSWKTAGSLYVLRVNLNQGVLRNLPK